MKTREIILMILLIVILIVPLSCVNKANQIVDIESEKAAIQNVVDAHFKYMDSYDLDKLLTLQTEDILEMPPNVPPLVGRDGYAGHLKSWLDYSKTLKNKEMSFPVSEFVVTENWAFQIGTYRVKFTTQDDNVIEDEGNFVWLFKKDSADNWKWARVISNSTKPLQ
jgi:ketosteroid isomerase-like protein